MNIEPTTFRGWPERSLGELTREMVLFNDGDWIETKDQDPAGDVRLIQLADVGDGVFRDRSRRYLTSEKARALNCTFLETGDVLVARMPEPLGRACVFPGDPKASVTAVDVCILRPDSSRLNARWLMHTLNAPQARLQMESFGKGTTRQRISRSNLAKVVVPVPRLEEQCHIAARLDEALGHAAATRERLDRVPVILRRFRQSVLAAAVSGQLTVDWRAERNGPDWTFTSLASSRIAVRIGPFGSVLHRSDYVRGGIPLVNPTHIRDGTIVTSPDIAVHQLKADELAAYRLKAGDVVLGRRGEMGRAAVVTEEANGYLCGTGSMILRADQRMWRPRFLSMVLRSPQVVTALDATSVGSTMTNLNQRIVAALELPKASLAEQDEVVSRVSALAAFSDSVERRWDLARQRCDPLSQAILARAFRGEL